jgi:hypothetical protein
MKWPGLALGITVSFLVTLGILHAQDAKALGQTEEGILYGLGIYKIYDVITEEDPWEPGQSREYGDQFPPFSCRGSGIECAYQKGVYEREKEEWEDAREKAYECGRYGRNCDTP